MDLNKLDVIKSTSIDLQNKLPFKKYHQYATYIYLIQIEITLVLLLIGKSFHLFCSPF